MKVHIVTDHSIDPKPYNKEDRVHKVFFNLSDAEEYVKKNKRTVFGEDLLNFDYGYMINPIIHTKEVL